MTQPKFTADAACENSHLVAQDLVERIRELLFDLPAPGNDEHPIHWGHVGSINEVTMRLSSMVAFLEGTELQARRFARRRPRGPHRPTLRVGARASCHGWAIRPTTPTTPTRANLAASRR